MLNPASILIKFLGIIGIVCSIYIYRTREKYIQNLLKRYARCETKSEHEAAYSAAKSRAIIIIIMVFIVSLMFVFFTNKFLP